MFQSFLLLQNKWVFLIQDAVQENLLALSFPFLLIWSSSVIYFFITLEFLRSVGQSLVLSPNLYPFIAYSYHAFLFWCWRRLLRIPWTAKISNQSSQRKSTLNILWKDWCWSWNSNTLAARCKELTHWKNPDAGKDWRQKAKGVAEDAMVRLHHQLNGCEFEQTAGDREGQGSLACCSPWCHKESDSI